MYKSETGCVNALRKLTHTVYHKRPAHKCFAVSWTMEKLCLLYKSHIVKNAIVIIIVDFLSFSEKDKDKIFTFCSYNTVYRHIGLLLHSSRSPVWSFTLDDPDDVAAAMTSPDHQRPCCSSSKQV